MGGMGLFRSAPKYTAELLTNEFLEDLRLTDADHEDYPLKLVLDFKETIGDGNSISYLHLRREGQVTTRYQVHTGDKTFSIGINPAVSEFDLVAVDDDDQLVAIDEVEIRRVN